MWQLTAYLVFTANVLWLTSCNNLCRIVCLLCGCGVDAGLFVSTCLPWPLPVGQCVQALAVGAGVSAALHMLFTCLPTVEWSCPSTLLPDGFTFTCHTSAVVAPTCRLLRGICNVLCVCCAVLCCAVGFPVFTYFLLVACCNLSSNTRSSPFVSECCSS